MLKMRIGDESHARETLAAAKHHLHPDHHRARSFLRIGSIRSSRICSFGDDAYRARSQRHHELLVLVDHDDVCVVDGLFDLDGGVMPAMECISKT